MWWDFAPSWDKKPVPLRKEVQSYSSPKIYAQASVKNFPMWKKLLMLIENDSEILRCRGSISNAANLPYSTKHPPSNHLLSTLYLHQAHAHGRVFATQLREGNSHQATFMVFEWQNGDLWWSKSYVAAAPDDSMKGSTMLFHHHHNHHHLHSLMLARTVLGLYVSHPREAQSKVWIVLYTCCHCHMGHSPGSCDVCSHSDKQFSS